MRFGAVGGLDGALLAARLEGGTVVVWVDGTVWVVGWKAKVVSCLVNIISIHKFPGANNYYILDCLIPLPKATATGVGRIKTIVVCIFHGLPHLT